MEFIIIDLEFNQPVKQLRFYYQEIIEIGAVKLNENLEIIDSFQSYVKPKYLKTLHWKVKKITGINNEQLDNTEPLEVILFSFLNWCGTNFNICSFGIDDLFWFLDNCKRQGLPVNWLRKFVNIQTEIMRIFDLEKQPSLTNSLKLFELEFLGEKHQALADALNTVDLFFNIYNEIDFDNLQHLNYIEPIFEYSYSNSGFRSSNS